jgi:glycine cleavage system H protein
MEIPEELRYSKEHEWVRLDGDVATVGITDFAQDQLGDIVILTLPEAGATLEQFAKAGEIDSVKSVSDIFTPVGGTVLETNQLAVASPELVNRQPYAEGWLFRIHVTNAAEQLDRLLSPAEYASLVAAAHG